MSKGTPRITIRLEATLTEAVEQEIAYSERGDATVPLTFSDCVRLALTEWLRKRRASRASRRTKKKGAK